MSSVISVKYLNGGESWTVGYRNAPYVLEFDEDLNEIWSIKGFTIFVNRGLAHVFCLRLNHLVDHGIYLKRSYRRNGRCINRSTYYPNLNLCLYLAFCLGTKRLGLDRHFQ